MTSATIIISAGEGVRRLVVEDIDFSQSRDTIALGIGRKIIDSVYSQTEGAA